MFLPIHDENPRIKAPIVTLALIGITLIRLVRRAGSGAELSLASST